MYQLGRTQFSKFSSFNFGQTNVPRSKFKKNHRSVPVKMFSWVENGQSVFPRSKPFSLVERSQNMDDLIRIRLVFSRVRQHRNVKKHRLGKVSGNLIVFMQI